MSTIAALRPGCKLVTPTYGPQDSVHFEMSINKVNDVVSAIVLKPSKTPNVHSVKPKKKKKKTSMSAMNTLMIGVSDLQKVSTKIANLKIPETDTFTGPHISVDSESPPGKRSQIQSSASTPSPSNSPTPSKSLKPSPSTPDTPTSTQVPQPVLKKIEEAILTCLPQLPASLEFSAWLQKTRTTDEEQCLENEIKLPPTDANSQGEPRYAHCEVQGQLKSDGQMKISVTINFYTHQHIKCKEVLVKESLGVAINNSSLHIDGVKKKSCLSDDDDDDESNS